MLEGHGFLKESWKKKLFQKGDLKYVILDLIKDKPRYGYEVIRALEERSNGFYKPSAGAVYPTFQMLEEMGYATANQRDGKKVYTITDEGLEFLLERKDYTEEIKGNIERYWNPDNFVEVAKTLEELARFKRLFGHRLRHLNTGKMQRIRKIIARAYEDIDEIMKEGKEPTPLIN